MKFPRFGHVMRRLYQCGWLLMTSLACLFVVARLRLGEFDALRRISEDDRLLSTFDDENDYLAQLNASIFFRFLWSDLFRRRRETFWIETADRRWPLWFLREPHQPCTPQTQVLVFVTSAPRNRAQRRMIRKTWGSKSGAQATVIFVLGRVADNRTMQWVSRECHWHGDVLLGSFLDSYYNLTLKTLSLLLWTESRCPAVPMLLKTDDDVFVLLPNLLSLVARFKTTRSTIFGRCWDDREVFRDETSKWFVSRSTYSEDWWPRFCSGTGYLLSGDSVSPLLLAGKSSRFLPLEDTFLTGVVAEKANVSRDFRGEFMVHPQTLRLICGPKYLISFHRFASSAELQYLWDLYLKSLESPCNLEFLERVRNFEQNSPL